MLVQDGDYWVLHKHSPGQDAATLVASALPPLLRRFPWPKSMRWGGSGSLFTWIRPLRRILCILDGATIAFTLADGADDGHGLRSGNETEGHRFMAPGAFPVHSAAEWQAGLLAKRVMADAGHRRQHIADGVARLAAERDLTVVDDPALLDEVAGLVEWPVPLLGRIDPAFMDLPPEVMQVSMRVNQRYFALRNPDGSAAPFFAFAANMEAADGGAAIVAGNERVLRARFGDARHFWDADRRVKLTSRVAALDAVTFHAKLGTQGARVRRIMQLAAIIAPNTEAERAAFLCKADLTTGMVGEFPELQGVMGSHYARDDEAPIVVRAIRDHYKPLTAEDSLPVDDVAQAVALADKMDLVVSLFAVGEKPTGSSDPYALRRAGLGIVRLILENWRELRLLPLIDLINSQLATKADPGEVTSFIKERLRFFLVSRHAIEHDVTNAVFAADTDDDLKWLRNRARDVQIFLNLSGGTGSDLLRGYKRASRILDIERKSGFVASDVDPSAFNRPEEDALFSAVCHAESVITAQYRLRNSFRIVQALSDLRFPIDAFFDRVTVNDPHPGLRRNRLNLLHRVRATMDRVADFSRIEG